MSTAIQTTWIERQGPSRSIGSHVCLARRDSSHGVGRSVACSCPVLPAPSFQRAPKPPNRCFTAVLCQLPQLSACCTPHLHTPSARPIYSSPLVPKPCAHHLGAPLFTRDVTARLVQAPPDHVHRDGARKSIANERACHVIDTSERSHAVTSDAFFRCSAIATVSSGSSPTARRWSLIFSMNKVCCRELSAFSTSFIQVSNWL